MDSPTRTVHDASLNAIAARLKRFREAYGLSQADVCRRTGIKPSAWSNYEQAFRRIPLDNAITIRAEWGLGLEWIYLGDTSGLSQSVTALLFASSKARKRSPRSPKPKR